MNILVSACLLGVNCKYNGENNKVDKLAEIARHAVLIPICPEQLGGLATPRLPAEIQEGDGTAVLEGSSRIMNKAGKDVTAEFIKGAEETLNIAKLYGCQAAILKERSPSCGGRQIYDGSFDGIKKQGQGVAACLLERAGIKVYSEETFEQLLESLVGCNPI